MKTKHLFVLAFLMAATSAVKVARPFKLGETLIDFDEEAEVETTKEQAKIEKTNYKDLV